MKKWLAEFANDMVYIWRKFRHEVESANSSHPEVAQEDFISMHAPGWNGIPDLDTRKPVNNLDNFYTREIRGTNNPGTQYRHTR